MGSTDKPTLIRRSLRSGIGSVSLLLVSLGHRRDTHVMPCYRCGRVQTDPVRGASPWARGVVGDEQVLICPECQQTHPAWTTELRRCPSCGGSRLSVMLGDVVCRECGYDGPLD